MVTLKHDMWRGLSPTIRARIAREFFEQALERYAQGAIEHGEDFHGDPIDHAEEELMDLWFYLAMVRRERDENDKNAGRS